MSQPSLADIAARLDLLLERTTASGRRFLGVQDAAAYSGLSTKSVRRLLAAGKLSAYRPVKGRVLVDRQQLDSLILGSARQAQRKGRGQRTSMNKVDRKSHQEISA